MKQFETQQRSRQSKRFGYTLVELVIAVGISSTLVVGLPSSIYIVSQSMNADNKTINRSSTAEVHTRLVNDLKHATTFSELTNLAVTMVVPDRDNDSQPETIRYSWSGTGGDSLMYEYNGGTPIALATDVHAFDLSYLTRLIEAPEIPDPEYIPDGDSVEEFKFGNESKYDEDEDGIEDGVIATKVTLDEEAYIQSITAYIENEEAGNAYYFAIFSDLNGSPFQLLAYSDAGYETGKGWKTLAVPETYLKNGTYWLGIGFTDDDQVVYRQKGKKNQTQMANMAFSLVQIAGVWPGSANDEKWELSIYGTYTQKSLAEPAADSDAAASSKSSGWDFSKLFGR